MRRFTRRDQAKRFLDEVNYPHSIHPALVPGVSVEDQKVRYGVDKVIVGVVGAAIIGFVAWGVLAPQQVFDISGAALTWVMHNLGWVFNVLAIGMVILLLVIALSLAAGSRWAWTGEARVRHRLWAAMLFGAGIGIGIIFFGPFEPLTYYLSPRPGAPYDAGSVAAMKGAIAQSALHWGINAWAIYAIVGLASPTSPSAAGGAVDERDRRRALGRGLLLARQPRHRRARYRDPLRHRRLPRNRRPPDRPGRGDRRRVRRPRARRSPW